MKIMLRRFAAATFALSALPCAADMDRFGNVIRDDEGGGYSNSVMPLVALGGIFILTLIIYKVLEKKTAFSSAANFNMAWVIALVLGGLLMAISQQS